MTTDDQIAALQATVASLQARVDQMETNVSAVRDHTANALSVIGEQLPPGGNRMREHMHSLRHLKIKG